MPHKSIIIFLCLALIAAGTYTVLQNESLPETVITEPSEVLASLDYVGLSIVEAGVKAEFENTPFRVIEIDGEPQPTTRDYQAGRINATVENGVVVTYYVEDANTEPVREESDSDIVEPTDPIIGMTVAEAEAYTTANDIAFRVGAIDGELLMLTEDYREGRITAEVTADVITGYSVE